MSGQSLNNVPARPSSGSTPKRDPALAPHCLIDDSERHQEPRTRLHLVPKPVWDGLVARNQLVTGTPDSLVDGDTSQHIHRLARLGYLAPDIVTAIVEGRQPALLSGRRLLRCASLPIDWDGQRRVLGFV